MTWIDRDYQSLANTLVVAEIGPDKVKDLPKIAGYLGKLGVRFTVDRAPEWLEESLPELEEPFSRESFRLFTRQRFNGELPALADRLSDRVHSSFLAHYRELHLPKVCGCPLSIEYRSGYLIERNSLIAYAKQVKQQTQNFEDTLAVEQKLRQDFAEPLANRHRTPIRGVEIFLMSNILMQAARKRARRQD